MRKDATKRIEWRGNALCLIGNRKPVVTIEPDEKYPSMWRVRLPDGRLTDMVNRTRARDAARAWANRILNSGEAAAPAKGG